MRVAYSNFDLIANVRCEIDVENALYDVTRNTTE